MLHKQTASPRLACCRRGQWQRCRGGGEGASCDWVCGLDLLGLRQGEPSPAAPRYRVGPRLRHSRQILKATHSDLETAQRRARVLQVLHLNGLQYKPPPATRHLFGDPSTQRDVFTDFQKVPRIQSALKTDNWSKRKSRIYSLFFGSHTANLPRFYLTIGGWDCTSAVCFQVSSDRKILDANSDWSGARLRCLINLHKQRRNMKSAVEMVSLAWTSQPETIPVDEKSNNPAV